jgi:hypothetical protein
MTPLRLPTSPLPQFDASGNLIVPPGMVPMSVRAADGTVMMMLVPAHLAEATTTKSAAAAGAGATGAAAATSSNGTLAMASSVPSGSGGTRTTAPFITDGELARTVAASSVAGSTRDASAYVDMPMDDADTIMNDGSGSAHTFATMQRANSAGQLPPVWAADPGDAARQQRTLCGAPPLAQPPAQW